MTIKRVFKNTMPGTQYLFKNGKAAAFMNGRYETDVDWEIAELDQEIRQGIPHIFIDPNDTTVDTGMIDFVRQRQIEATKQALIDYENAKNGVELSSSNQVPSAPLSTSERGSVFEGSYEKESDGTLVKPGASEEQRVQTDRNDVPVPAVGAAKEVPVSPSNVSVVKPEQPNMAKLLALKASAPNTGVASTANMGDAGKQSS